MVWDEEAIRLLRALWTQGLSTAEIGRRLGVSKNAIVGKAHRLELEARPSPIRRDPPKSLDDHAAPYPRVAGPTLPPLPSAGIQPITAATPNIQVVRTPPSIVTRPPADAPAVRHAAVSQAAVSQTAVPRNVTPQGAVPSAAMPSAAMPSAAMPRLAVPRQTLPRQEMPRQATPQVPMATRRSAPSCCWPIGDPGTKAFRFCDETSAAGKPYCEDHAKLAYVKLRDRKEDAA